MQIDNLGYLAMMAAGIGRQASPLAGGIILLSGIAAVSPVEVVKRTAPAAVVMLISVYFLCQKGRLTTNHPPILEQYIKYYCCAS